MRIDDFPFSFWVCFDQARIKNRKKGGGRGSELVSKPSSSLPSIYDYPCTSLFLDLDFGQPSEPSWIPTLVFVSSIETSSPSARSKEDQLSFQFGELALPSLPSSSPSFKLTAASLGSLSRPQTAPAVSRHGRPTSYHFAVLVDSLFDVHLDSGSSSSSSLNFPSYRPGPRHPPSIISRLRNHSFLLPLITPIFYTLLSSLRLPFRP